MKKAFDIFNQDLSSLRTGKANVSMLDIIKVDIYGQNLSINLVGTLTTLLWKESSFIMNIVPDEIYGSMDEVLPAITFSVISLVLVSLLTQKKNPK